MLFGFKYNEDMYFAEGESQAKAKDNLVGLTKWKMDRLVPMDSLPVDLGKFPYTNVDGQREKKTVKEWDAMWRSDRGHGRHER